MYNDTYLTLDDEMELEDAGLDLEELAEMDWDDRYDAIYEAGLDPFDYEYGFPDDEPEICVSTAKAKEEPPKCETVSYPKCYVNPCGESGPDMLYSSIREISEQESL